MHVILPYIQPPTCEIILLRLHVVALLNRSYGVKLQTPTKRTIKISLKYYFLKYVTRIIMGLTSFG